jgi:hypothetical protein
MSEDMKRFLDLEQQATDLTLELERLREETMNYSNLTLELERLREETMNYSKTAKGLDDAISQLEPTTAALLELVGKSRDIIETLGSIGTAELLARTREVKNELDEFQQEVSVRLGQIVERLEQIEKYERRSMFSKLFGGK